MKRKSIVSLMLACMMLMQVFTLTSGAIGMKNENADPKDQISKDSNWSVEVSEADLLLAHEIFMQFTYDNDLPVSFDFESFKQEYFSLGYNSIDDYLDALYGIFNLESEENNNSYEKLNNLNINVQSPEDYRAELGYSEEILQAYEEFSISLASANIPVDLCLENFARQYEESKADDLSLYCNNLKAEYIGAQSTASGDLNTAVMSSSSSSSSSDKYYYNIGDVLQVQPNYNEFNILQLAQRGDVIIDEEGSGGQFGHAAIVEGKFYCAEYGYYVSVIEAILDPGVSRGLLDAQRTEDRDTYLYKVYTATPEQKDAAVEFCIGQMGKPWHIDFGHDYSPDTKKWMCSQLVWAAYKNQGIDIERSGNGGGEPGVTPHDITKNSKSTTHVDIRCDLHTVPDGTYYLTNCKSGLRLDIRDGTPGVSVQVQQYAAGPYEEQKWRFTYHESGRYYTIKSNITANGSFYLDVASPASGANAKVKLWNTWTNPEERWFIQRAGDNTYCFINGYSGLCMDIFGASMDNRADVQVYPYVGADDQKWMLSLCGTKLFDDGVYYITNYRSGMRLDIRHSKPGNSVQIQQFPAGDFPEQKWVLEWSPVWSCYYIRSNITSYGVFYLDVASPASGAHAKVKLWNEWVNPEERWTIVYNGDGTYRFINGYDGLCMDIMNGSTESNADVQVFPYVDATDQKWTLQKVS